MEIAEDKMVGAIFMCNRTTLKECFRSKVLGLPSRYTEFVGKVKAGMLLFLFEYEERKLYGVYEAATDGTINISSSAFSKTKRTFPAQVMYEIIWKCYPLTEDEFRDAIRDNYFAPYKFHFGLSHEQVATLLDLFSPRKSKPKNQPSTYYLESHRMENGKNVARRSASIDDTDSGPSLDYNGSMYNQHFEPVHKIQNTDMDLRTYLTRDRVRDSNESHTSLDTNPKDMLGGKHTLYTHDPDLVFKNQADLDNEYIPYHISHSQYQQLNLTGSTSQLEYYPEEPLHLSPITQQIYPNYGIESTSVTVAPEHVEPKCNYRYSDLDNYRYSSTDYLKESNLNKIGADASNLAPKFTSTAYSPPQNFGTMPLKIQDNSENFPSLSMERCLNFDYDSLALKYRASSVMDHTSSLNFNSANRYGYWKMHPESSNSAYIGKSEFTASVEAADDLSKPSLEPNSTTKDHDVIKRYYRELQSSEPCDMKEYDATFGHYRNIYPSKFSNANEYEREHLEFQSETPKRKSVFSRISKNIKPNDISGMEDKSPSQLLSILAQRKKKWNKIINSPKSSHHDTTFKRLKTWHRVKPVDTDLTNESKEYTKGSLNLSFKKIQHMSLIESKDNDTTGHVKNDENFELESEATKKSGVLDGFKATKKSGVLDGFKATKKSGVLDGFNEEETMGVPIKNFKRRSVTQEKTSESAVKGKRPRLIRPSFTDHDTEGVANESHLALESNKSSVGLLPGKESLIAENCEVALEANKMSIGASSGKDNAVAENFQIENKIADFNLDQNSHVSIKVEPMEEENVLAMAIHMHNQMSNNTVEMAENSGFTVQNKKTDVSYGLKSNMEERHILASRTHYDEANDTNETVQSFGFQAESRKTESKFDRNSNVSIKVEPVEEGPVFISHSHINKPNDTNVMAKSSGFQAKSKKIEVNIAQKSNLSIKVEPVEEEHIFTAHIQNDTLNGTIEKVETLGKDHEQVSYSSVASKAIVHGNEGASSRLCIDLKNVDKSIGSHFNNVKENVHLDDTTAVIFQADFGAEPISSSEENTESDSFKSPNLCIKIKTNRVEERSVNSSRETVVKSENSSNLCVKTDQVEGCFAAENRADLMKSSAENTGIKSGNKSTSLCTNFVENDTLTSEREKKSSALINLNEAATTNDVIGGKSHVEPDATADF